MSRRRSRTRRSSTSTVADELGKFIFDQVIKDRKIRYDDNGQDYAFSRKLDDRLTGHEIRS